MSRMPGRKKEEIDMTMPITMSIVELALGLAAWGLGLAALFLRRKADAARMCGIGSLACCAASLCVVVFDFARLADLEDTSSFLDTAGGFRFAAGVLLAVTLALNAAALILCRRYRDAKSN